MSGQALPVAVFCLATGAALGCLFLLFQGMSQLLGLKKLGAALVDVLFCCLCGGFVFLCALAVDSGRGKELEGITCSMEKKRWANNCQSVESIKGTSR